ncbi:ead/Ea22-like family protein [Salmonella enterica subsp. enterica serovar Newport]|nr:ead/Ea22-like family protein [Salmonella enterica subsp. enterica serovar Newport]
MNIDKQALREAAEKVNSGDWSYEEFNRLDLPGGSFVKIDGRDAVYCLNKPVGGIKQSRAVIAFIATFNPKVALALLDELEKAQRANVAQDDHINQQQDRIEQLEIGHKEAAKQINSWRRLAKQNIAERGKDISELEAARQRIAELEAKLANPVLLPKTNGYWNEQEKAYEEAITLAKRQVRLAGFSVEDM